MFTDVKNSDLTIQIDYSNFSFDLGLFQSHSFVQINALQFSILF